MAAERAALKQLEGNILHAEAQRALEEAAAAVTARFIAAMDAGSAALIVAQREEKSASGVDEETSAASTTAAAAAAAVDASASAAEPATDANAANFASAAAAAADDAGSAAAEASVDVTADAVSDAAADNSICNAAPAAEAGAAAAVAADDDAPTPSPPPPPPLLARSSSLAHALFSKPPPIAPPSLPPPPPTPLAHASSHAKALAVKAATEAAKNEHGRAAASAADEVMEHCALAFAAQGAFETLASQGGRHGATLPAEVGSAKCYPPHHRPDPMIVMSPTQICIFMKWRPMTLCDKSVRHYVEAINIRADAMRVEAVNLAAAGAGCYARVEHRSAAAAAAAGDLAAARSVVESLRRRIACWTADIHGDSHFDVAAIEVTEVGAYTRPLIIST